MRLLLFKCSRNIVTMSTTLKVLHLSSLCLQLIFAMFFAQFAPAVVAPAVGVPAVGVAPCRALPES